MKQLTAAVALAATLWTFTDRASAETVVRVGWCARTVSSAAAPYAIATKLGWYAKAGIKVELVPLPGSTDCVKNVATGEIPYSLPSIEPLAIIRPQGVKAKNFYTAYQANIYGIMVPADSPVKSFADRFSRAIAEAEPDTFTANIRKVQRKGRIFLDWLRNQRGATAVLPYSARAREGAPVAAPVAWDELDDFPGANHFTIRDARTLLDRASSKALAGWGKVAQTLPDA